MTWIFVSILIFCVFFCGILWEGIPIPDLIFLTYIYYILYEGTPIPILTFYIHITNVDNPLDFYHTFSYRSTEGEENIRSGIGIPSHRRKYRREKKYKKLFSFFCIQYLTDNVHIRYNTEMLDRIRT